MRVRVRTMMIVVAVVGLLLGIAVRVRRAGEYRIRAQDEAEWVVICRMKHFELNNELGTSQEEYEITALESKGDRRASSSGALKEMIRRLKEEHAKRRTNLEQLKRLIEYHDQLQTKYEYAAAHPWYTVAPDPPEPPLDFDEK